MRTFALLLVAACTRPGYYVADVQPVPGGIAVTKCAFDSHGKATSDDDCKTDTLFIAPPPVAGGVEPPAAPPRQPRPAPTAEQIHAALSVRGVHDLLAQCRATYSKAATFEFRITIDRKGVVGEVAPSAIYEPQFVDCATRALRTANIAHFDGEPVTYDEVLPL